MRKPFLPCLEALSLTACVPGNACGLFYVSEPNLLSVSGARL